MGGGYNNATRSEQLLFLTDDQLRPIIGRYMAVSVA